MKKLALLFCISIVSIAWCALNAQPIQRKCGTMEYLALHKAADPTLENKINILEQQMQNWIDNNEDIINDSKAVITIPVVVHIVYNTKAQNITDARVNQQIDALNKNFAGLNTHSMGSFPFKLKVNTNIQFCLAKRKPDGTATTGIERRKTISPGFDDDSQKFYVMGGLDAWDPTKYFNIWVCNLEAGIDAYSQFPTDGINSTYGVVIHYQYFGITGATSPKNFGGTTTHAIGHCFNLLHIWGDDNGACTGTDKCTDTPNQAGPTYGAHTGLLTDACTNTSPGIMYMNFMDESDDISYSNFTPNQKARMLACFANGGLLYSLSVSNGCTPADPIQSVPTGLNATSVTHNSATLKWNAYSGASSYGIRYRKTGTTTWTNVTSTTNSKSITGLTSSTIYEFQVRAVCLTTTPYSASCNFTTFSTLTCTDTYEPNNSISTAKTISVNTSINALINTYSDHDWYKFSNTSSKKNIKITLTNLPKNYNIDLFTSNAFIISSSTNTGATSETIKYNNAPVGTYYIRVIGINGAYSNQYCYTLKAQISSSPYKFAEDDNSEQSNPEFEAESLPQQLLIYPNPAKNAVNITYKADKNSNVKIKLIDITGRVINIAEYKALEGHNTYLVDIANVSNGFYYVKLENGYENIIQKLLIEK